MLPGLDGIPAAAVLDRLALLKYRNALGSHIYIRPSDEHRVLLWHQTRPGRELSALVVGGAVAYSGYDRRGDQRADARDLPLTNGNSGESAEAQPLLNSLRTSSEPRS